MRYPFQVIKEWQIPLTPLPKTYPATAAFLELMVTLDELFDEFPAVLRLPEGTALTLLYRDVVYSDQDILNSVGGLACHISETCSLTFYGTTEHRETAEMTVRPGSSPKKGRVLTRSLSGRPIRRLQGLGRLIIKSVQERHYLGAVAYLRRRKGRFGLAVCYVVGDGPNDRAAAERIISNIAEAADIADIGASLRTIEERYHLAARTRLLGREFCAARSLGYAVFDGPANGIITIIAIVHIVKRHPCIDRRLAGCAPEEGHYLAACACLLRAKVALIKAVCDALFDRPIDGLGVILIRSNVNKAGLLRLCYRRIADRARRISHCSGRACGYRSARFTEISASVIVILLAGVRYIHSIIRRSSDSQQRAQQRENKKQCN